MGEVRHILNVSGGKDSAALAIYMLDHLDVDMEYVFCDTGYELPETYDYLNQLEAYLDRPIVRLTNEDRDFNHYLILRNGYLPSPQNRWCTELLKIRSLEAYVGNDEVLSYVGLRADEDREGYKSTKPNIHAVFPFQDDGLGLKDVEEILRSSGLGMPEYYKWRSRSGCYFCFYQRKVEWVGLLEHHPDRYFEASKYERPELGDHYTWSQGESLLELARPERVAQVKAEFEQRKAQLALSNQSGKLLDILDMGDQTPV